jgi:rubrerythrin
MEPNRSGGNVQDVPIEPDAASIYECLDCGERLSATSHPGTCPECSASLRNCGTPLE